jgi:hypothetical protein
MNIFTWTIFAAGFGFFIYEARRDAAKATLQRLHLPPGEKNQLLRDKDGYYDPKKGNILDLVFFAVILGLGIGLYFVSVWAPLAVGAVAAALGLFIRLKVSKQYKTLEKNRTRQFEILRGLKSDPDGFTLVPTIKAGKWVLSTFYDFSEPSTVLNSEADPLYFEKRDAALAKIKPRLAALANLPESKWFTLERSKLV